MNKSLTPLTDAEGFSCEVIQDFSAVTAGSYVRLFNLSKSLEKTLTELTHVQARNISEQLNWDWEKQRNELRAELISAHGENERLLAELATERARSNTLLDVLKKADREISRLFQTLPISGPLPCPSVMQECEYVIHAAMKEAST